MEGHPCAPERDGLAVPDRLRGARKIFAVAQAHEVERLVSGKHGAMPRTRVIGVAVRDHSFVHRARGVDMEAANLAANAGRRSQENSFGTLPLRYDATGTMTASSAGLIY